MAVSYLDQELERRRQHPLQDNPIGEIAAIAFDLSVMASYTAGILDLICAVPAIRDSPDFADISELVGQFKGRLEAHSKAMAELNSVDRQRR